MTETGRIFIEWKEQFVSQERGKRVVHYFLRDSTGESVLAVVGTERSVRHMFYVIDDEFLQSYGEEHSVHASFKWRSRREVVDWLTSMLSKEHIRGDQPYSPTHDLGHANESTQLPTSGLISKQMQEPFSSNLNARSSDIVWSGVAWTCGKQLKHYPSFCRNGIAIRIQSFVFVMAKGENHYLAYLEDMYEDKRAHKKVKVRWFHHNQEVKGVIALKNVHPREVFITPYSQVISAECVDGSATVLTREHYEECLSILPKNLSTRIHMCLRQFRSNKVKPFDLQKLRGYNDQPILSCLKSRHSSTGHSIGCNQPGEEDEELNPDGHMKLQIEMLEGVKGTETLTTDHSRVRVFSNQIMECDSSYLNSGYGISAKRFPRRGHLSGPNFKMHEKIELLCQDSGIRGCWFRGTVLQIGKKQIKVRYEDLQDEDEHGQLEEWVPTVKKAVADKLGMRHPGRPTIRPAPPLNEEMEFILDVGSAVDAWWSDGWWEGVVTGVIGDDILQVYFPGESFFSKVQKEDLRLSKDWVGDKWMDIEAKPDVVSVVSATISSESKISTSAVVSNEKKTDALAASPTEHRTSARLSYTEAESPELAILTFTKSLPEFMDTGDKNNLQPLNVKAREDSKENNVNHDKEDMVPNNGIGGVNDNSGKMDVDATETFERDDKIVESAGVKICRV